MLEIIGGACIPRDDYAIAHLKNGLDELRFELSVDDQNIYRSLREGLTRLREHTENQSYVVRKINSINGVASVVARLDLADWERDLLLDTSDLSAPGFSHTLSEVNMLTAILSAAPSLSGWTVEDRVTTHSTRSMEMDGPTPLEAAVQLQKTFGCALRFYTASKKVTIFYPDECHVSDSFAIESVNLRRQPEYKGHSAELCTRLYPVGKDGLGIASVNGGVPYLDNTAYTGAGVVICKLWKDARYTDAASLMRDAQARLETAARPAQSWKLDVIDLKRIDAQRWPDMTLAIWTKLLLQDRARDTREIVQVVSDLVYPYYPDRNQITVSTRTETLQEAVLRATQAMSDPNGEFWGQINAKDPNIYNGEVE